MPTEYRLRDGQVRLIHEFDNSKELLPYDPCWHIFQQYRNSIEDTSDSYIANLNKDLKQFNAIHVSRDTEKIGNPFYLIRFASPEDLLYFKLKFN